MMTRNLSKTWFVMLAAAGVALVARSSAQQTRTVGAGAEQLVVDFIAVGADGSPITDLQPGDLTLKVGGRNRVVNSLKLVKAEATAAAAAPGAAAAPVAKPFNGPKPYYTNQRAAGGGGGNGRHFYLVIDTETLRSGEEVQVRKSVDAFVEKLVPDDLVGIVAIPRGGVNLPPTSDRTKIKATIDQLAGTAPPSETTVQAKDRARTDLSQIAGMLRALVGSDTPSTFVYFSSSMLGPDAPQQLNQVTTNTQRAETVGQGELTPDHFNQVREIVGAAKSTIYVIQTEGGSSIAGQSINQMNRGLMDLAGAGGGTFVSHTNLGTEDALVKIAKETSAYYLASFDAESGDKVNTRYPISLKVNRPGVEVRVRPDFERTKAAATSKVPSVDDMTKTSDPFRDLPLRAIAVSQRPIGPDKDKGTKLFLIAEPLTPGLKITAARAMIYDFTGKLMAKYDVAPDGLAQPFLVAAMMVQPNQYRVRFAATDGKVSGAVDIPSFEIGLVPAGPFKLSGITLGTSTGGFKPKFDFSTETDATAFFELYGGAAGQQLSIQVELAESVDGPAIKTLEPKIAGTPEPDKYAVSAAIPLAELAPGDYVVRAIVGVEGGKPGTVAATIHKIAK